jgi:hypothetical protein
MAGVLGKGVLYVAAYAVHMVYSRLHRPKAQGNSTSITNMHSAYGFL